MSFGIIFSDLHVWIAISGNLFSSILTGLHDELLWPIRGTLKFVAFHFGFIDCLCSSARLFLMNYRFSIW